MSTFGTGCKITLTSACRCEIHCWHQRQQSNYLSDQSNTKTANYKTNNSNCISNNCWPSHSVYHGCFRKQQININELFSESCRPNRETKTVNSNIPKQPPIWFCNIYLRELGQANTQPHRIETGDALPIRQHFYRQSPQSYAEMNRQLQEC